jgi:hypothetical protein
MLELKDGDAEIGLLPIVFPNTTDPGPAFSMHPAKEKYEEYYQAS